MTITQIVTRFQSLYKEQSTRYYNTQWQIDAANDSIEDIASEIDNVHPSFLPTKIGSVTYAVNQQEYALPTDFLDVIGVEVVDLGGPPYIVLTEIDFEFRNLAVVGPSAPQFMGGGSGEPVCYYIRDLESGQTLLGSSPPVTMAADGSVIGFVPIPARNGGTNNVRIFYNQTRGNITAIDSTVPDLPLDFHGLIALRMCVLAAISDGLPTVAKYAALYNDRLERRLAMALRGRGEGEETIEITDLW